MKKNCVNVYVFWLLLSFSCVAYAENSTARAVSIHIGLDCDKRTSTVDVLINIRNEKLKNPIYFDAVQLGLDGFLPNVYEIIPSDMLDSDAYKYAVLYTKPISVENHERGSNKSYFMLLPNETIIIRDPVSRFYKIDLKLEYRITTFFSFKNHDGTLIQHQIRFHYSNKCFDDDGVDWLSDVQIKRSGG